MLRAAKKAEEGQARRSGYHATEETKKWYTFGFDQISANPINNQGDIEVMCVHTTVLN